MRKNPPFFSPAETYLRVRARNQPGVTSFGPISCEVTVIEYRAKASGCAREVATLTTQGIGEKGKRERDKDFLSFGSLPFPFLKGIGNSRVAVYRKGKKIYISPSWPPEWYRPSYHPISSGIDLANILDRNYALRTLEMVFQSINGFIVIRGDWL